MKFLIQKLIKQKNIISQEKKKDIISMMPWAPEVDKNYLKIFVIKIYKIYLMYNFVD